MFVLNQMLGTILIHPDWDTTIQWSIKYITFGASVFIVASLADVMLAVNAFEGYHG